MKKVLLTLLGIIVVAGVLAGAGFAGYRIGYNQGIAASADGTVQIAPWSKGFGLERMPMHNFGNDLGLRGMPMHNFNRGFERGGFGMMDRGMRFNFFSSFHFLVRLVLLGLIIWLAYKLIKGNGWKLSLTRQTVESPKVDTATTEKTE